MKDTENIIDVDKENDDKTLQNCANKINRCLGIDFESDVEDN